MSPKTSAIAISSLGLINVKSIMRSMIQKNSFINDAITYIPNFFIIEKVIKN
jgi:hypothetical protein